MAFCKESRVSWEVLLHQGYIIFPHQGVGITQEGGAQRAPGATVQEGDESHSRGRWKHPKGDGRITGDGQERQSWQNCPWGPLCLAHALQLACHRFGREPCVPLHDSTSFSWEAWPRLNCPEAVAFSLKNTFLLLYKFSITRDSCSDWRTRLLLSCGFQLISSQLTVFKYSESCKFPYHSS